MIWMPRKSAVKTARLDDLLAMQCLKAEVHSKLHDAYFEPCIVYCFCFYSYFGKHKQYLKFSCTGSYFPTGTPR